jgi:hypothetical protein
MFSGESLRVILDLVEQESNLDEAKKKDERVYCGQGAPLSFEGLSLEAPKLS